MIWFTKESKNAEIILEAIANNLIESWFVVQSKTEKDTNSDVDDPPSDNEKDDEEDEDYVPEDMVAGGLITDKMIAEERKLHQQTLSLEDQMRQQFVEVCT